MGQQPGRMSDAADPAARTQNPERTADSTSNYEPTPTAPPFIYVESMADYNQDNSHGAWIDATKQPEDIEQAIRELLAGSPAVQTQGESLGDWAIHAYDGFGLAQIHEHDDLEMISKLANGIVEHGLAFSAWADMNDDDADNWERFHEVYLGEYDDLNSYAEQFWEDMGWQALIESVLPSDIARTSYLMAHSLANDLWMAGDIQIIHNPAGRIWVFRGDL